jgi:lytic cellulose monooxygenase (C1-hydroxylating)
MSILQAAAIISSLAASASAHGIVQGIVAGGKWYSGYNPNFQFESPPPTVIGWSIPQDESLGFVAPSSYSDPDIICHIGATPGGASAKVEAGSVVELQWTVWPDSHHGPVIDYLAKCSGSCTNVDKTSLEFFKIDQGEYY